MKTFEELTQEIKINRDLIQAKAENIELDNWIFKNMDMLDYDLRQAVMETLI